MRPQRYAWPTLFSALLLFRASAATLYVSLDSTNPVPPYADWSTAATNIQDAVDASTNGDLILVTNGVYQSSGRLSSDGATNCVIVTNAITLEGVNGPAATLIDGRQLMRCVYLRDGAMLTGFTITNGNAINGGGVWATNGSSAIVSNCVLAGNIAGLGGGAFGGRINDCLIIGNGAYSGGGVAYSQVTNSVILSNSAAAYGGGAETAKLWNSKIFQNTAGYGGGADGSSLYGCLIVSNVAWAFGGGVEQPGSLINCTIVGNSAGQWGGGCDGGNFTYSCIIYYNVVLTGTESNYMGGGNMRNCCTTPLPSIGVNNITNAPSFVDYTNGDFHLQSDSPCINSGINNYVTTVTDFDGDPRIVGGTVDIGAYEYQTPVSQVSYAWLRQYGLPITTNTDTSDPDGDGMNNYQEWFAGTNPTNVLSVLAMLQLVPTNNPTALVVSWQIVSVKSYYLQRSTSLGTQPIFSTIRSNIPASFGHNGTLSVTDTGATNNGPYFYRVGVQ